MPWLFLLLAIGAFAVALRTTSMTVSILCLVASLGLLALWIMTLLAQRVGHRSRSDTMMLDPVELRKLREQAEARRVAAGPAQEPPASS